MMGVVRGWLLGITAAAILAALVESLMPEGSVKQVGKLVCGLMLTAAVLRPLGSVELTDLAPYWAYDEQQEQLLQEEADERMKKIIEAQLAAYSMDKAQQLGLPCQIQISCRLGSEGVFLPDSAQVTGLQDEASRRKLASFLASELGVKEDAVRFCGEGEP